MVCMPQRQEYDGPNDDQFLCSCFYQRVFRCIQGGDVRKTTLSNKIAAIDAYLRLTLGKHKRAPTKKSKVVAKMPTVCPHRYPGGIAFNVSCAMISLNSRGSHDIY